MTESVEAMTQANEREYRVVGQMLTMHSSLRDRMERRAFWLNTALIASSLLVAVFAFVGDDLLMTLGANPPLTRFILGFAAVVVLIVSITEFRVDWRSAAGRHGEAASRLASLKSDYRRCFAETGGRDVERNRSLSAEYTRIMSTLPAIPNRWFNTLKAEHQYKRVLSERISKNPKAPVWFLRLQLRIEGMREAMRS
jgi:hypothetical protein